MNKNSRAVAGFVVAGLVVLSCIYSSACASGGRTYVAGGVVVTDYPHGRIIQTLPRGHVVVRVDNSPYYYHSGVFFKPVPRGYQVIVGPPGAAVKILPRGHKKVRLGGVWHYHFHGTYFKFDKHRKAYIVVRR
jgi:hypothetical protein